ncbi:phospholipase/carboxylesterase [Mesorhizobium sp. J18]|uniref:alpha/beta hydrolase n=1 Tax=Mesorhizobium sp. J18 TaxID=935263 RepID=UPI00119A3A28|nr:alpha/beta hydrolase [Mesorhizobium sp. J18]TWG98072.1 phospholipase/carboxylesterase [Mesorhizobium sp. J18]
MSIDAYKHKHVAGGDNRPLFFLFHGTGGDENQFMDLAPHLVPGAGIVAPRGDVSEYGAARFFRRTGEGVYDMQDLARATAKMADFVRAHVEAAKPSAVLGLGYSNGANILASVLFAGTGLFDAAILMHPLIPFVPKIGDRLGSTEILITAGRHDPICPPDLILRLESCLKAAGADVRLAWHEGGHELRQNEIDMAYHFLARYRGEENAESADGK